MVAARPSGDCVPWTQCGARDHCTRELRVFAPSCLCGSQTLHITYEARRYLSIPGITACSAGCWSRTEYIRSVVSTHSGQCWIWTSMKPRVIACSRRYSYIPRVNARSVHGWGQTLHSGIQLAGTCWYWSRTEHGTPWSLLQSLLDLASAPSQGLWPLSLVLESYSRG